MAILIFLMFQKVCYHSYTRRNSSTGCLVYVTSFLRNGAWRTQQTIGGE